MTLPIPIHLAHFRHTCLVDPDGWLTNGHYAVRLSATSLAGEARKKLALQAPPEGPSPACHLAYFVNSLERPISFDAEGNGPLEVMETCHVDALPKGQLSQAFPDGDLIEAKVSRLVIDETGDGSLIEGAGNPCLGQAIMDKGGRIVATANPDYLARLGLRPGSKVYGLVGTHSPWVDAPTFDECNRIVMPLHHGPGPWKQKVPAWLRPVRRARKAFQSTAP